MLNFLKKLFAAPEKPDLKAIIEEGAFLVDVRTPKEHAQQKVYGSVNIPLHTIPNQLDKFKGKKNIIVFCRSGNRSSQAKSILQRNGFTNVVNGGSAADVKQFLN